MANMQTIEKVDVKAADGGLAQVLELTKVNQLLVDLIKEEGVTNLEEFASLWTKDGFEKEAQEFRDKVDSIKGKMVEASRLRIAIQVARGVLERPKNKEPAQGSEPDVEAPLDPMVRESMAKAWTTRYHLHLTMWLDPADSLVNRLYREFRTNSVNLLEVTKFKSVYTDHNPTPEKKVTLAEGLVVTVAGKDQGEEVTDVVQYYFGLRVLANASAKAGNYEVESKVEKGAMVTFAPLDTNLNYADHALRMALKQHMSAWGRLKWLTERDLSTRSLMINYMRSGWSQGEALTIALKEEEGMWRSLVPLETASAVHHQKRQQGGRDRSRSPRQGGKGGGKGGQQQKAKKQTIGKTQRASSGKGTRSYANMAPGNRTICRAFNDGNCKGEKCPYGNAHVCSVIHNGKPCFAKHPACRHSFGGQGR
jgi:hypothetical protein